jgi:hypothetical protein
MRLRSRGLGRKELVLDFREYEVVRVEDELVVVGTIRDPVNWDFTIRICEDDVPGMTWLVLRRAMLSLLLRSFFRRKKRDHWGQERAEHLAEGKKRRQTARDSAVGVVGRRSAIGAGSPVRIAASKPAWLFPRKGRVPVVIS